MHAQQHSYMLLESCLCFLYVTNVSVLLVYLRTGDTRSFNFAGIESEFLALLL